MLHAVGQHSLSFHFPPLQFRTYFPGAVSNKDTSPLTGYKTSPVGSFVLRLLFGEDALVGDRQDCRATFMAIAPQHLPDSTSLEASGHC
jgi:hypothetical protein